MSNPFGITKEEIETIFTTYQQRSKNEEVNYVQEKHGGVQNLIKKLNSSIDKGITENTKASRIAAFDDNIRYREPMPSMWFFICDALGDTMLRILILCAIFQISIGVSPLSENPKKDWIDGIAIVFAIVVIVITTSVTNYNKEKKFKQLSDENFKKFQVVVMRNGSKFNIPDEDLVVGDVCKIDLGMIISADGILISSLNLKTDESALTGESNLMRKETLENCLKSQNEFNNKKMPSPLIFSGTTVKEGSALMLVLAVGKNSVSGKIREQVMQNKNDEEDNQTPLQIKLEDIANDIGNFGLWSAILTLTALLIKLFWAKYSQLSYKNEQMEQFIQSKFPNGSYVNDTIENINNSTYYLIDQNSIWSGVWKEIISAIILCIAIIVVAIPEGLPLAVTLSLSFSIKKMMDDNNLVRHMHACETMGGANYICTDKTGTLTRNKMHVVTFFNNSDDIDVNMVDSEHPMDSKTKFTNNYFKILRDTIMNNLDIELYSNGDIIMESSSKTDFAFFDMMKGFKQDFNKTYERIDRIQFHSDRKKMSTIVKSSDGKTYIYMKGAPEVVINSCSHYFRPNGDGSAKLSESDFRRLKDITGKFSSLTLRNLAIAYKEVDENELYEFESLKNTTSHLNHKIEQGGFTLIGIAAISDALRQGVPESVSLCHSAHVKVIMITGDDEQIARAIAKNAGIISEKEYSLVLTGTDFITRIGGIICRSCKSDAERCNCPKTINQARELLGDDKDDSFLETKLKKEKIKNMDEFKKIVKSLRVIARARAVDKFALVSGLRELGNVVAVTGDGTNDAPALSKADVGFAMGKTGTDVARDAADIIILDDNFNSIVHAIKWGRNIFDNIRKFIQFQLSVNLSAVLLVFVSSCIGSESPITAIQMLWINLIMDSLGSLALATEDPCDELLFRKPHSKREYIISPRMWKHIIAQSLVQFTLVLLLYLFAPHFIQENHPERLYMINQLENCFGDFIAESSKFKNHAIIHYIFDGKKSSWSPLIHLRRNLDPKVCLFYDTTLFEPKQISNLFEAFKWYTSEYGNTCHMTMIFNTFVMYSLFNQINCRILDDSLNIFKRITKNWLFLAITFIELVCQFLIVQFGGLVFKCSVGGLTSYQWGLCFGMASITFGINFIMKLIKCECIFTIDCKKLCCCCCKSKDDEELKQGLMDEENSEDGIGKAERVIEMSNRPLDSSKNHLYDGSQKESIK